MISIECVAMRNECHIHEVDSLLPLALKCDHSKYMYILM